MGEAHGWLADRQRTEEVTAIEEVLSFRQEAAGAACRTTIDVDNIEELFSLGSAEGGAQLYSHMQLGMIGTVLRLVPDVNAGQSTSIRSEKLELKKSDGRADPKTGVSPRRRSLVALTLRVYHSRPSVRGEAQRMDRLCCCLNASMSVRAIMREYMMSSLMVVWWLAASRTQGKTPTLPTGPTWRHVLGDVPLARGYFNVGAAVTSL